MGLSWEKLFFSWDFLGTFDAGFQYVIKIFGYFVGKTFFFVGLSWEKVVGMERGEVVGKIGVPDKSNPTNTTTNSTK